MRPAMSSWRFWGALPINREGLLLYFGLMAGTGISLAGSPALDPEIPISLSTFVNPTNRENYTIPLAVTVANGMKGAISFGTFSLDPVFWNGETSSLTLVDVYRNGAPGSLFLEAPKITPPLQMQSPNHFVLKPGQSLTVKTDIAKWKIRGGWSPGRYTVTVRVENLATERGRHMVTVLSEPISFEILP